jgi:hypothetical protein
MSSLNHALDVIEELSTDEKFAIYDFLRSKLSERLEDILISEYQHTMEHFTSGKIKSETVDEMFDRLGI